MRKLLIFMLVVVMPFVSKSQANIAEARVLAIGTSVTVTGIVLNGSELGNVRYIQDSTAGIAVYNASANPVLISAVLGDKITVTGVLKSYNSLLEIDPVTLVTLVSTSQPLPPIQIISPSVMIESVESEIVQINHCIIQGTGNFAANTNYTFVSNGESGQLRTVTTCPLVGQPIPTGAVNISGVVSQFSYSGSGGYQLLVRNGLDILPDSSILINSPVSISNLNTTGFTLSWTTNITGSSQIQYGNTPNLEIGILDGTLNTVNHTVSVTGANAAELFYVRVFSVHSSDTAKSSIQPYITQSNSSGNMKVYFTRSTDNSVSTGTNAITLNSLIDDTLINYINRSKYTLDIAIYSFSTSNLSDITGAINNAKSRGVSVRIVHDGAAANTGLTGLDASIGVISNGNSGGIMHNKFVVIDADSPDPEDAIVWTGSTNWTDQQINNMDANNVIIIHDQSLAKAYKIEFEEMYGSTGLLPNSANAKFGSAKADNTPHEFIIGGNRTELYFSPSDSVTQKIINTIETADNELYVETNLITKTNIADAISNKASAGVITKAMVNSPGNCTPAVISILTTALGNNFKEYVEGGILHHKLLISDPNFTNSDPLVLTGSHNWSASAETVNDENILVIHNAIIANIYYQEFVKRFGLSSVITDNDEIQVGSGISLYPNPCSQYFIVIIPEKLLCPVNISLIDISGKVVDNKLINSDYQNTITFNISNLSKGLYFVKIQNTNSLNIFKKISVE
jgi:phosphatidylserine/phosphatidylglycerophosphate/cardiolipin synthase-like enzyme